MNVYKFFSVIPIFTPIIFINLTFFLIPQTKIFIEEEFAWFYKACIHSNYYSSD